MNIEYVKTEAVQLYDSHREWYAVYDSHDNTVIALCFDEEDARRIVETYTFRQARPTLYFRVARWN